jgi:Rieske Fe-S protein
VSSTSSPAERARPEAGEERRRFLASVSAGAMAASLLASYGALAAMAARFLLPARARREAWMLVSDAASFRRGTTRSLVAPTGARIVVARRGAEDDPSPAALGEFLALSSTCPHLGCQVRFEPQNRRFFCPCHNGSFDPDGRATGGPPFEAGQSLPRYELKLEAGLLFIRVPLEGLS